MQRELISGGCQCGAIRYAIDEPFLAKRQCWCRACQFIACGSCSTNVVVRVNHIVFTGTTASYRRIADSGNHMTRRFCPICGTHVSSGADATPGLVVIRAGTLDDPSVATPDSVIWTDSAPPWASIDPALPAFPKGPPPR